MHKCKFFCFCILFMLFIINCGGEQELSIKLTNETAGVIDTVTVSVASDKQQAVSAYNLSSFDSTVLKITPEVEGDGELFLSISQDTVKSTTGFGYYTNGSFYDSYFSIIIKSSDTGIVFLRGL